MKKQDKEMEQHIMENGSDLQKKLWKRAKKANKEDGEIEGVLWWYKNFLQDIKDSIK